MFTKIAAKSVSDEIVDQVLSAILTGRLAPGDRLPPERVLAQAFGVGRQALREALQKLQGMGLIRTAKPHGTFVQTPTPDLMRRPLSRLLEQEAGRLVNFLDVRKWLEGMTAAEAAEHATPEDLDGIEAALRGVAEAAERNDREALDAADIAFHLAIVTASHNPVMVELVGTFRNLMWSSHGFRLVLLELADAALVCEEHRAVAEAIRAKDPVKAREAMTHHIEMIRGRVEGTEMMTMTENDQ
jgi:GntR family transcriptional repressor for pyruvate dehydrogenase complex